jgi:hypothetical protein
LYLITTAQMEARLSELEPKIRRAFDDARRKPADDAGRWNLYGALTAERSRIEATLRQRRNPLTLFRF